MDEFLAIVPDLLSHYKDRQDEDQAMCKSAFDIFTRDHTMVSGLANVAEGAWEKVWDSGMVFQLYEALMDVEREAQDADGNVPPEDICVITDIWHAIYPGVKCDVAEAGLDTFEILLQKASYPDVQGVSVQGVTHAVVDSFLEYKKVLQRVQDRFQKELSERQSETRRLWRKAALSRREWESMQAIEDRSRDVVRGLKDILNAMNPLGVVRKLDFDELPYVFYFS